MFIFKQQVAIRQHVNVHCATHVALKLAQGITPDEHDHLHNNCTLCTDGL
jgi:hypothetical protein